MSFKQEKMMTVKQNAHDKFVHVLDVAVIERALFMRVYKIVPRSIAPGMTSRNGSAHDK